MKVFLATWSEPYDMFSDITYTYLVLADNKDEAIKKLNEEKKASNNLKVTEYEQHKNGIIYIGASF